MAPLRDEAMRTAPPGQDTPHPLEASINVGLTYTLRKRYNRADPHGGKHPLGNGEENHAVRRKQIVLRGFPGRLLAGRGDLGDLPDAK